MSLEAAKTRSTPEIDERSLSLSAEESLPDRQRFILNAEASEAFEKALSAPSRPAPRLARLLNEPSVFEKGDSE
jgi:uncharacterized protein (DUF1778 family)